MTDRERLKAVVKQYLKSKKMTKKEFFIQSGTSVRGFYRDVTFGITLYTLNSIADSMGIMPSELLARMENIERNAVMNDGKA